LQNEPSVFLQKKRFEQELKEIGAALLKNYKKLLSVFRHYACMQGVRAVPLISLLTSSDSFRRFQILSTK
jgi:hypothetical protein